MVDQDIVGKMTQRIVERFAPQKIIAFGSWARGEIGPDSDMLLAGGKTEIEEGSGDLVYALDMFHQVTDPGPFLAEVRRIVKDDGRFILEDGHQERETTRRKLSVSDLWEIESENERYVTLRPVKN